MKKLYLIFFCLFSCLSLPGIAGNILGGELTYSTIAPGIYHVNFRYVQDCSPVAPAPFVTLQLKSPGCNPVGRNVKLNKIGGYGIVTQTCPNAFTPNCSPGNQAGNAFSVNYSGIVSFTIAEQNCQNWIM